MRKLFIILFLLIAGYAEAAAPSRVSTYTTGTVISSSAVTGNEDALFNYVQAGVSVYEDLSIFNADINSSANIQSDKLNLTAIAQSVANSGSTTLTGTFAANGTTNSIGNGGSDVLTLNVPGGMTLSAATTWTLTGALTFSGTIANLGTVTTANIDGGTMDGVQIGGTTATGELLVNDSNDDADGLGAQGTSGQYLQSAGAGANPTWVTPLGVLLSTTTFSAASTSEDITITSGKKYMVFVRITATSIDQNIYMLFNTGDTTTYAWVYDTRIFSTSPTSTLTGDDSDTELDFGSVNGGDGYAGVLFFDNTFVSAGEEIFINGKFGGVEAATGTKVTRDISGLYDATTTAPTNFRIIPSTGTFTGQIDVYELN